MKKFINIIKRYGLIWAIQNEILILKHFMKSFIKPKKCNYCEDNADMMIEDKPVCGICYDKMGGND